MSFAFTLSRMPPKKSKLRVEVVVDGGIATVRGRSLLSSSGPANTDDPRAYHDLLFGSLSYAIKRTQVRCDEAMARCLDAGLSPARFAALCTVGAYPGISQTALGALLNIAGPSVVKVVDGLESLGLVTRESGSDRRVHALQLTTQGAADLKRYHGTVKNVEKLISATLTAQECVQLLALLAKVAPDER